eukprot:595065-Hanusia_phi.AAC.1
MRGRVQASLECQEVGENKAVAPCPLVFLVLCFISPLLLSSSSHLQTGGEKVARLARRALSWYESTDKLG